MVTIVPIVEGTGDEWAVKTLVERYFDEERKIYDIRVSNPVSAGGRTNITTDEGLKRVLGAATTTSKSSRSAILVVLDADDNPCPPGFAKSLARRAKSLKLPYPVGVVVAKRCYESWLIASITEIARNGHGLKRNIRCPRCPEDEPDPKAWLTRCMERGAYDPQTHQGRLTRSLNFHLAKSRCHSFRRLLTTLDELIEVALNGTGIGYVTPQP